MGVTPRDDGPSHERAQPCGVGEDDSGSLDGLLTAHRSLAPSGLRQHQTQTLSRLRLV